MKYVASSRPAFCALVAALLLLGACLLAQAPRTRTVSSRESHGLTLTVDCSSKRSFAFSEPIEWTIRIRVTGRTERPIWSAEWFPIFSIVDGKGDSLRLTAYGEGRAGRAESISGSGPVKYFPMVPDQVFVTHLWVNRIYDLSELQAYSLSVQCKMPSISTNQEVTLTSPLIDFEVVEPSNEFLARLRSISDSK